MDNDLTPQSNGGAAQPQGQPQSQPLDPSVVALTKAIGTAESGGKYTAPDDTGDNANSNGAYQMTPGFLSEWAPKAGVQYTPGMKLNPQQQDEVAYNAVKTMGTTGDPNHAHLGKLTPAQITSDWNTGDPNAYLDPDYGKNNTYGSTEKYVDAVSKNYEKEMGSSEASSPLVSSADASNGSDSSGSSPNLIDSILTGGAAATGWLLSKAWQYGQKPIVDAGVDAAIGGGEGGIPGAVVGAGTGLVQGVLQDITGGSGNQTNQTQTGQTQTDQTPQVTPPTTTPPNPEPNPSQTAPSEDEDSRIQALEKEMPQVSQASQEVAHQVAQDYGSTVGGTKAMQDPNVRGGIEEIGMNGWGPKVVTDDQGVARNDYKESRQKADNMISDTSESMEKMLNASGGIGSMADTLADAEADFAKTHGIDASERAAAKEYFKKQGEAYLKENGDGKGNMSVGHFEKMKREKGHGKKWDMTEANWKREADKSLSRAARRTVEKSVKPEVKELYNRANKKMQRMINARNIMKKLDGKKARKNPSNFKKLMHAGGKYAALYIGDKIGGPLGAILGSMVGEHVTRAVDKRFGKTIFETPAYQAGLKLLQAKHPDSYLILQRELKKAGIITPKKYMEPPKKFYHHGIANLEVTTNPSSGSPTKKQSQSPSKPQGKALKGLIQLPTKRQKHQ